MQLSFGARLRAQRERNNVSLDAISAATKIKVALLEELESDNVTHWPSGLFRRAYIRDYAKAIGLDPAPIVAEFLQLYPDPLLIAEAQAEATARAQAAARSPEARVRRLFSAVLQRMPGVEPDEPPVWTPPPMALPPRRPPAIYEPPRLDTPAEANDAGDTAEEMVELSVAPEAPRRSVSLPGVADLCTRLARVVDAAEVVSVLADAAQLLDATGVIVWAWDPHACILTPSLAHGYSDAMLRRMPGVPTDAPNAIAGTFRTAESTIVASDQGGSGAIVVPMMTPPGCVGVVSLETRNGAEQQEAIRSVVQILAAQLATILEMPTAQEASA